MTRIESLLFWVILVVGSFLIVQASLDYFLSDRLHPFLMERPELANESWWSVTLYLHVVGGLVCLLSSITQYSKVLLKRAPKIHRYLGRIYALSIVLLVFPSGVALSFFAKGGWVGMIGFLLLSFATLLSLILGMIAIYQKQIAIHKAWISRSFALITTAITFRTLQLILVTVGLPNELVYQLALWLSIIINVWLAEYYIYKTTPKQI